MLFTAWLTLMAYAVGAIAPWFVLYHCVAKFGVFGGFIIWFGGLSGTLLLGLSLVPSS
jgi:hypothetical protein